MTNLQRADFSGKTIYVGMDVHLKSWDISIFFDQQHLRSFHQPPDASKLVGTLQKEYPNAILCCAYEAGFSGYWIQRQLQGMGISCMVVNPADVPQTDKGRKTKTDRADSKRIGKALQAGLLHPIYIPDRFTDSNRKLVRYRQQLLADLKRCKARIKHFLLYQGIHLPDQYNNSNWSSKFISWLKELKHEHETSRMALHKMVAQVESMKHEVSVLNKDIQKMMTHPVYEACAKLIQSVPGIGPIITASLLVEIADIKRFPTFAQFNSFIGLCPGEHSSGDEERKGKIISRHHSTLRALLIEAAWTVVKKDPAMTLAFSDLKTKMTAKRAIIRIARKLLNRLYHVWIKNEIYENGIVK